MIKYRHSFDTFANKGLVSRLNARSKSWLRQPVKLAEFKPALGINPDILARYTANRLRVVRQAQPQV